MYTANTMAAVGEALGLSLPGSASPPSVDRRRDDYAVKAGAAVVELIRLGITTRDILTKKAFENAITVVMALGGSTNAVLHLLAIANEAEVELDLADFQRISERTPLLGDLKPFGKFVMTDIDRVGGIPVVLRALLDAGFLHGDCLTVTGKTMAENLAELTTRGLSDRWPVILGGAALTRSFVEVDLASSFTGTVRYAKDAFEGLRLMDAMMAVKRGVPGAELPALRERKTVRIHAEASETIDTERSDVATDNPVPTPPFYGSRIVKGIALSDYVGMLDERALFMGQWGLKGARGEFEKMAESEGRPRLRALLNQAQSQGWLNAAVVYGYFPCYADGNDLVILHHQGEMKGEERLRFSFPRQRRDRRLCLSDFFRTKESGEIDTVAFHVVTMGQSVSEATAKLFAENNYREYLELHGLSVQLTEALAEHWHARIREELNVSGDDSKLIDEILDQGYRGSRYSFGYPACPDIEQQVQLCELLEPERIGVELSEEFQLHPEQSTSAIIVHHPEAKYFNAV
jgi:5-methyltetrahydrofolate--homocysteine methyltransferase